MSDPHEHLRTDPTLQPLLETYGELTLDPADDLFERLVVSILRQQVSMAAASAIRERLFEAVEVTPAGILATDDAVLEEAGLSRQKVQYLRNVAAAFDRHGYDRACFADLTDDEVRAELTSITGVGQWTADMQLMFALGREDVFPVGDLGIRKGMATLYPDLDRQDRAAMQARAEQWRPYRSYASLYLWRLEEGDAAVAEVRRA